MIKFIFLLLFVISSSISASEKKDDVLLQAEKLVSNVDKLHQHIDWMPRYNNLDLIIQTAVNWEKKINE